MKRPKKPSSKRQVEKLINEIDALEEEWGDDFIFDDEDKADFEAARVKSKPEPPSEAEPTSMPVKRKVVQVYAERKEFDAEAYDVSRQLVAPTEAIEYDVTPEPEVALKKAFRPPKNNPVFRQKWNTFIHNIVERDNFNKSHLEQLTVLCDMFVEYEILITSLHRTGYTYIVNTVIGAIPKPYPEVAQLNRVRAEIRNYMRILGLLLVKDKSEKAPEDDKWE